MILIAPAITSAFSTHLFRSAIWSRHSFVGKKEIFKKLGVWQEIESLAVHVVQYSLQVAGTAMWREIENVAVQGVVGKLPPCWCLFDGMEPWFHRYLANSWSD